MRQRDRKTDGDGFACLHVCTLHTSYMYTRESEGKSRFEVSLRWDAAGGVN